MGLSCSKSDKKNITYGVSPALAKSPNPIIHVKKIEKKPLPVLKDLHVNSLYQSRVNRGQKMHKESLTFDTMDDFDSNVNKKIKGLHSNPNSIKTLEKIREINC